MTRNLHTSISSMTYTYLSNTDKILSNYPQPAPTSLVNREFYTKSGLKNLISKYYNLDGNSLYNIINTFFNDELNENQRYFLLLKIRLGNYGWRTLHHGIITSRSYMDNYIEFVKSQINLLSEEYKDEDNYQLIVFQYFQIPKSRWSQFPESKWTHINRKPSVTLKIEDFHNKYKIPLNMNYDSWGNVIFKLDSSMTVEGIKNFNINFDHKLNINSIYTSDIKFIDIIINKQYFKRSYKDFTYYIDNIEQKIVFTLNKINTKKRVVNKGIRFTSPLKYLIILV